MEITAGNRVYIHIGFPKTGTTTLQAALTELPALQSLGLRENFKYLTPDYESFFDYLTLTDGVQYSYEKAHELYQNAFREVEPTKSIVISDEKLAGVTHGDPKLIAKRLHKFFPQARVLITLRNQPDLVRSYYEMEPSTPLRNPSRGAQLPLDQWLDQARKSEGDSILPFLTYDTILDHYWALLGRENVSVALFEQWIASPEVYVSSLNRFFDLKDGELVQAMARVSKQNTSDDFYIQSILKKNLGSTPWMRLVPNPVKQRIRSLLLRFKPQNSFSEEQLQFLKAYYRKSNQRLEAKLNLNLAEYGYPV